MTTAVETRLSRRTPASIRPPDSACRNLNRARITTGGLFHRPVRPPHNWLPAALGLLALCASTLTAQTATMPDLLGSTVDEARRELSEAGVTGTIHVDSISEDACPEKGLAEGLICVQTPAAGASQRADLDVWLTVLHGVATIRLPGTGIKGRTVEQATERARSSGFTGEVATRTASPGECTAEGVPEGWVCHAEPAGGEMPANAPLTLFVQGSRGLDDPFGTFPDIVGMDVEDAVRTLTAEAFGQIGVRFVEAGDCSRISSRPTGPRIVCGFEGYERHRDSRVYDRRSQITLTVQTGYDHEPPELYRLPDLIGDTMLEAWDKLDSIGVRGAISDNRSGYCRADVSEVGIGEIWCQSPLPGVETRTRTPVQLMIRQGG